MLILVSEASIMFAIGLPQIGECWFKNKKQKTWNQMHGVNFCGQILQTPIGERDAHEV